MMLMAVSSVLVVALALERLLAMARIRRQMTVVENRVVGTARRSSLEDARKACDGVGFPIRSIFTAGLDRALGQTPGDAAMAMHREQRRVVGGMRAWVWMLGTAGALMPFVGLLGTVLGVMSSFRAIGESGQGGFAVVSAGISQALIATAVGLFVALEAVVLFNLLQNIIMKLSRDLALLVDEMVELIQTRREHAGNAAK
jgi:biopolymer transport protein ExbB